MGHQGHPRETNLPHDMGLPRPELAGRETGRGIYRGRLGHLRWELAGREMGRGIYCTGDGTKVGTRQGDRKRNLTAGRNWQVGRREEEFTAGGWASWELAGRETGRGIYRGRLGIQGGNWQAGRQEEEFNRRRWDIQGRRIYHMTWDFQGRNWQVGRREEEFTAGGWASWELAGREMGRGRGIWEQAGSRRWDIQGRRIYHMTWDFQGRNWQVRRQEEEFTRGGGASKAGTVR